MPMILYRARIFAFYQAELQVCRDFSRKLNQREGQIEFPKIEGDWRHLASGKVKQLILGIVQPRELLHSMHIASTGVMLL